jgi:M6 family metalloprotease-like protein
MCRVVALFARFPDEDPQQTIPPSYAQDLFDPQLPGSFTHFYHEMSLGRFTVEGVVLPTYYTSNRPASGYHLPGGNTGSYFGTFNREVLEKADRDVDFGYFDNDGPDGLPNSGDDDGYVDFLFIIVESKSTLSGFLPGGRTGMAQLGLKDDFITNDPAPSGYIRITSIRGATQRVWSFASAVGIMAHEFGHGLGLPDLYDLLCKDPEDDSAGIGKWGIMAHGALGWHGDDGPVPFCAWSREQLGWTNRVEITEDVVGQVLRDVATTGTVYKIPLGENGSYYLLENRQSAKSYYDRHLPQDGLLIWHIQPSHMRNWDERNKMVDLVCADGLYLDRGYPDGTAAAPDSGGDNLDFWAYDKSYRTAHTGNLGDATDVFDGVQFTALTPYTNPRSKGGVGIEHIRRSGTRVIADIRVPKWSGPIADHITWDGVVNVVGDIVVQEGATLNIRAGTRVRFSSTDALRRGTDPDRIEIDVFGTLTIGSFRGDPVCFTAEGKGRWVGIRLHEPTAAMHGYTDQEVRVEDCDHPQGIFWSEHPDAKRPELHCMVHDGELGNGDGMLHRNEPIRLVLDIRNWTRRSFRGLCVTLSTDDPFVRPYRGPLPFVPRSWHPDDDPDGEGGVNPDEALRWDQDSSDLLTTTVSCGTVVPGRTERSTGFLMVDSNCPGGHRVVFKAEFKSDKETWTETFSVQVHSTDLATDIGEADPLHSFPISFALRQNVPNPFNAETILSFELPQATDLRLTLFNTAGQRVRQWEGTWSAGYHTLVWNGQDEHGIPVASGIYFYRAEAKYGIETRRMTLLK